MLPVSTCARNEGAARVRLRTRVTREARRIHDETAFRCMTFPPSVFGTNLDKLQLAFTTRPSTQTAKRSIESLAIHFEKRALVQRHEFILVGTGRPNRGNSLAIEPPPSHLTA